MIPFLSTKNLLMLAVSIFMLTSCEKDVTNIKLPSSEPKLVVGCFISPQDSSIIVTLTRSAPVFGPGQSNSNGFPVEDASVVISNGSVSSTIPFSTVNYQYELQANLFPIVAGQTYYLTVTTPKGESVSANCTVPVSNLSSLMVEFTDTLSEVKRITVKWQDKTNEANYYKAFAQMVLIDTVSLDTLYDYMFGNTTLFNDNGKDGSDFYSKLEGYTFFGGSYKAITGYDIYVLNVDMHYYNYQKSLDNYTYDDPFSEPSPIYTNIKGGLGIFAGVQKLYVRVP